MAAGYIAKGRRGRGALAARALLIAVFAVMGLALAGTLTVGGALIGLVSGFGGLSVGVRAIIFAIFGAIASTTGGFIGRLLPR